MARILKFQEATFDRRSVHDPVAECPYDFYDVNGKRCLQINMYERAGRKTPARPSQVSGSASTLPGGFAS
jgi:hypothetical protein